MTVYLLCGQEPDAEIIGVFSTKEKARECAPKDRGEYFIVELVLDQPDAPSETSPVWR